MEVTLGGWGLVQGIRGPPPTPTPTPSAGEGGGLEAALVTRDQGLLHNGPQRRGSQPGAEGRCAGQQRCTPAPNSSPGRPFHLAVPQLYSCQ